ncbi:MAG TPA: hypothetical protein GX513_08750 [Firmicutes bacterium]|nr:hypothetical protein [Bacillota bacterium]
MASPEEIARDLLITLINKIGVQHTDATTDAALNETRASETARMFQIIYRDVRAAMQGDQPPLGGVVKAW